MILKTKDMVIDIDRVSFVHETERMVVVEGQGINLRFEDDFNAIRRAFEWEHQDHMYDENMKRIRGN
jgi:phosphatidylserine/phosphatidylglycerophosphate/cardiolipin synthase-like enzyme